MKREEVKSRVYIIAEISYVDLPTFLLDYFEMIVSQATLYRVKNLEKNIANVVRSLHQYSEEYKRYISSINGVGTMKPHKYAPYMTDKMYKEKMEIGLSKQKINKLESVRKAKVYFLVTYYCNT